MNTSSPILSTAAPGLMHTGASINLRRLTVLRNIVLAGQALAVWVAVARFHLALPLEPLVLVLAGMAAINVLTWLRLKSSWPVHDVELFTHLMLDVFALTGMLYFTGGSTNPFAPLYLLPLTLTAAALPWAYTWAMTVLTVVSYSLLLFFYVPLPQSHTGHTDDFQLHVLGMWSGFLLSAGLIAYFAVRIRETLRERDRLRTQIREQELRHERVLALGTLAAGAAHELGTPLSTMAVLAKELERDTTGLPNKLKMLREQIGRCKEIMASLSAAAGQTRAEGGGAQALDTYLSALIERWRVSHPAVTLSCRLEGERPVPRVISEQTLTQALLNILNNAADVSPHDIEIEARWTQTDLSWAVRDRGPGLSSEAREHAGEPFFSTKAPGAGMGLGLFLARGTIERLGGGVTLANRDGGGAVCQVRLPLTQLSVAGK